MGSLRDQLALAFFLFLSRRISRRHVLSEFGDTWHAEASDIEVAIAQFKFMPTPDLYAFWRLYELQILMCMAADGPASSKPRSASCIPGSLAPVELPF